MAKMRTWVLRFPRSNNPRGAVQVVRNVIGWLTFRDATNTIDLTRAEARRLSQKLQGDYRD